MKDFKVLGSSWQENFKNWTKSTSKVEVIETFDDPNS